MAGAACIAVTEHIRFIPRVTEGRQLEKTVADGFDTLIEAQAQLREIAKALIANREYPGAKVVLRGNDLLLTNIPWTGGESPLIGIEPYSTGYKLVPYDSVPDYLRL